MPVHTLFLGFEIMQIPKEFFLFRKNEYLSIQKTAESPPK